MGDDFSFYSELFAKLSTTLSSYISEVSSSIIGAFGPVAAQLLTLYFIIYGFALMRGVVEEPITDFGMRVVRIALILGVALNVGIYNGHIVDFLWNSGDALARYVAGGSSDTGNNINFLDKMMTDFYKLGQTFWDYSSGVTSVDVGPKVIAILVWAGGVLLTGYAGFLLILSKVALAILLGIGPLFIMLMMFEGTKRFFESWLGQALNYVMIVVLTSGAVKLILSIIQSYIPNATAVAGESGSISAAIPAIAFSLIGVLVLMQLSSVASALGGGVAVSTLGAASSVYNKAKGATGGLKNLASGKTLSDMRQQRRQQATNAKWAQNNPGMTGKAAGMTMKAFRAATGSPNSVKRAA